MLIKIHKAYRNIVAVCDKELLGKKFEQDKAVLEVRESFFNGEEIQESDLIKLMKELANSDSSFNIVGQKSVNAALEAGIITKEGAKKVQGIPFALVLL